VWLFASSSGRVRNLGLFMEPWMGMM